MGIGSFMATSWQALQSGFIAARRVFDDPGTDGQQQAFRYRVAEYDILWSYYSNEMFDKQMFVFPSVNNLPLAPWQAYKSRYNLYRNIR
jgi:hypothetical protein